MTEQIDQMVNESGSEEVDVSNLSDTELDNLFEQQKSEDAQFNQPVKESSHEEGLQGLRHETSAEESTGSEERLRDVAESSGEDGREERSTEQVQQDDEQGESEGREVLSEKEQRSYKAALREERDLRKQMQQELAEQREASKKMSDAFQKLVDAADGKTAQPEPQIPSYEDDPIGHLNAKLEQANSKIDSLSKSTDQINTSVEQQKQFNDFMNSYQTKTQTFMAENTDYMDAYKHLVAEIKTDYELQGLSEAEAISAANQAELQLADQLMRQGKNPAETIYQMAQRRGYQRAQTQAAPVQDKVAKQAANMDRVERGMKASRSISTKGVSPNNRMSLEEIASLSDDEFDQVDWSKVLQMG